METRNSRTTIQGVVTSTKMDKTIIVTVKTKRNDPLYDKRVGYTKKIHAHDANNAANVGDEVTIMACRPISKTKKYRLVSIDKKAVTIAKVASVEEELETKEGIKAEVVEEAK